MKISSQVHMGSILHGASVRIIRAGDKEKSKWERRRKQIEVLFLFELQVAGGQDIITTDIVSLTDLQCLHPLLHSVYSQTLQLQ